MTTTSHTYSVRITIPQIGDAVTDRRDWKANSSHAHNVAPGAHIWPVGRLPQGWRDRLASKDVAYLVWSYATPVAWVHTDGEAVVPDVTYSGTTSRLQNVLRRALGVTR